MWGQTRGVCKEQFSFIVVNLHDLWSYTATTPVLYMAP